MYDMYDIWRSVWSAIRFGFRDVVQKPLDKKQYVVDVWIQPKNIYHRYSKNTNHKSNACKMHNSGNGIFHITKDSIWKTIDKDYSPSTDNLIT